MLPTSQDYWSVPTDIWFEKQIQNNAPPPVYGWAGCITDWLTDWLLCSAAGEKQWGSEALMPKRRPFIHLACQQWSLILWSPRIPVGADCVEDLSVQYHTHLPVLPSPEDLRLSHSCSFSTLSSLSPPFLSSLSSQGWRFTPSLLQTSASADSGCSSQFNPEDTFWHKEHRCVYVHSNSVFFNPSDGDLTNTCNKEMKRSRVQTWSR